MSLFVFRIPHDPGPVYLHLMNFTLISMNLDRNTTPLEVTLLLHNLIFYNNHTNMSAHAV